MYSVMAYVPHDIALKTDNDETYHKRIPFTNIIYKRDSCYNQDPAESDVFVSLPRLEHRESFWCLDKLMSWHGNFTLKCVYKVIAAITAMFKCVLCSDSNDEAHN